MKRGIVVMSNTLYQSDWDKLYIFFKDFRPTHIERRHWENDNWYFYGVSPLFDELTEGEVVPQYDVIFTRTQTQCGEILNYKFERITR